MMINKKGISAVVANVLIVLLVVASVAIIWAVVRPTIEQAGEGIEAGCFTVQVKPESCDSTNDKLRIYRRAGIGEITAFKILVETGGITKVYGGTEGVGIKELETKNLDLIDYKDSDDSPISVSEDDKVDIALVIGENICEPTGVPVTCRYSA